MIRIVEHASQLQPAHTSAYTMRELYDCVQYCPRVVSRLYLQIAAGSALIRSRECSAKWVIQDLQEAVRCEQNPVRGLFVRYFFITALRDTLPDVPPPPPPLPVSSLSSSTVAETSSNIPTDATQKVATNDQEVLVPEETVEVKEEDGTDRATTEVGTVKDSYEFILANFMEMNKLWVRIQHLPGEGKDKEARKRRERERNDLRILVGTNLVRLSQLESVTSKIYGESILPIILEHIVTTGDPLSQAYLMDCLVQVFPDEYHIETLPILLDVCPRLRDKVNIRTILQGLMDRLANYLAEEELLDESDTNQVKMTLARDSFGLFEECVQKVYNARGPKLTSKEVIRLQTALLQYSIKCFPGHVEQVGRCIDTCVTALRQANASYDTNPEVRSPSNFASSNSNTTNAPSSSIGGNASLDDASVAELEKLLSIPLDTLALKVLEFDMYSRLIGFLPWTNRREVAITMLQAVDTSGSIPKNVKNIEQLFHVIEPLLRDEHVAKDMSLYIPTNNPQQMPSGIVSQYQDPIQQGKVQQENCYVSKLVHSLDHSDTDVVYDMLQVAKQHLTHERSGPDRTVQTWSALVFAALRLARRVHSKERDFIVDETSQSQVLKEESTSQVNSDELEAVKQEATDNIEPATSDTSKSTRAVRYVGVMPFSNSFLPLPCPESCTSQILIVHLCF
jgi:vacuolar protein sorting-associated protein 35